MNRSALALATVLATAGFAAHAESPDLSGQFAQSVTAAPAAVQSVGFPAERAKATHQAAPGNSANPWSTRFNPVDGFRSQRTRAEVTADYIANRDRVAAFTSQDSGSAYLSANRGQQVGSVVAGQPANAQ